MAFVMMAIVLHMTFSLLPYNPLGTSLILLRFHESELREALHQSVNNPRHKSDQRSPLLVDVVKMPLLPFSKVAVQAFF